MRASRGNNGCLRAVAMLIFSLLMAEEVAGFSSSSTRVQIPTMTSARYSSLYMESPTPAPGKRPLQSWAWLRKADKKNASKSFRSSFIRDRRTLVAVTAIVTAGALALPSATLADITGITGGAITELASDLSAGPFELASATTSQMMQSLSETGFYQAFSLVFLSEIGDKTFFMAGLLAMKTSKFISFLGSMAALAVMTVISVAIGQVFHGVPSGIAQGIPLDDVAAVLAFAFFGIKTLKDAFEMDPDASVMDEELADAEETVEGSSTVKQATKWGQLISIFGLVFAAEFGDRSFLSTIALSAAQNPVSVAGGAIAAHAFATGIAVSGGAYVSKYISEKVIGFIGGTLFLVFAATTALGIF